AVLAGAGLDAHGVGAGVGLGEREGLLALSLHGRQQIDLALVALAGVEDLRGAADPADQAIGRLAELAVHQGRRQEIEAAAADLGRHVGAVEPLLHRPLLDLPAELERHIAETLGLALVRNYFLLHELADRIHEHALLFGQREIPGHLVTPPQWRQSITEGRRGSTDPGRAAGVRSRPR